MKLLRNYIRNLLINENACPIRGSVYGGIPTGGGFSAYKEYTVAAQQYFEAAHCILGSLGKRVGADGKTEWHSMVAGERAHLEEEIGIMLKVVDEYGRSVYTNQFNDISQYKEEWRERILKTNELAVKDIKTKAPMLIANAQNKIAMLNNVISNEPEFPASVYDVGLMTYECIVEAAEALLKSVEHWDQTKRIEADDNAWAQSNVVHMTDGLDSAIHIMIRDLS